MISDNTQTLLESIHQLKDSFDAWKKTRNSYQTMIDEHTISRNEAKKEMAILEARIDAAYLELRKEMNGELSTVPVSAPAAVEPVQIGREE
jgi:hypothetical protein